ncbi:MAG TPA: hypothetical protein H9694_01765 [Firmicutes bacterium]|nr:hypothetical protein [Bacillota bacterium]
MKKQNGRQAGRAWRLCAAACALALGLMLPAYAAGDSLVVEDFEGFTVGQRADDSLIRNPDQIIGEFVPSITGDDGVSLKVTSDRVQAHVGVGIRPAVWDWSQYGAVQYYIQTTTPEGSEGFNIKPTFEEGGPDWEWYLIAQFSPVYYRAEGDAEWTETVVGEGYSFWLPTDFKGYLQIPLENFVWASQNGDYQFNLGNVYSFCLEVDGLGPDTPFYIDDVTLLKEVNLEVEEAPVTAPETTVTPATDTESEPTEETPTESPTESPTEAATTAPTAQGGEDGSGGVSPAVVVIIVVALLAVGAGAVVAIRLLILKKKEK